MIKHLGIAVLAGFLAASVVYGQEAGAIKDPPHVTRMPAYKPNDQQNQAFNERSFCLGSGKGIKRVEGKLYYREYDLKDGATQASKLQIVRNYANAVRAQGGTVLLESASEVHGCEDMPPDGGKPEEAGFTGVIKKGNAEVWISVYPVNDGHGYLLNVLEVQAMVQEVTANVMLDALNRDGHVALYINFDTGKSAIRPESKSVIAHIVELMKVNPGLKVAIEGHTDNVGNPAANKTLSEARARSVMSAVAEAGIAQARMSAAGFGAERPLTANSDEAGRSKNRRVELVKR